MGGEATEDEKQFNDQWRTIGLGSATIGTAAATTTGANFEAFRAGSHTIMMTLAGNASATPTIHLVGGISGFSMFNMRSFTATADQTLRFRLGAAGFNTGADVGTTGLTRVDHMRFEVGEQGSGSGAPYTIDVRDMISPAWGNGADQIAGFEPEPLAIDMFSGNMSTGATVTSTIVDVSKAGSMTVMATVSGATSGVLMTLRGGQIGFGFVTLRAFTASAGFFAWRVGAPAATSGATADTTGIEKVQDLVLDMGTVGTTAATITVVARVLLSRSS